MSEESTQRELGRLAGVITEGFRSSRERYDNMRERMNEIAHASAEGHKEIGRRIDALSGVVREEADELKDRVSSLELTRSEMRGGWRALATAGAAGSTVAAALMGMAKWAGLIR